MKTSILTACSLFYCLFALAQPSTHPSVQPSAQPPAPPSTHPPLQPPATPLSTLPAITIELQQDPLPPGQVPLFSHFEIIDQRPDTQRIGIHTNKASSSHTRDRQMILARPAATEIAAWLNQHFTRPDAPYTGLIVLRSLWLSDASYFHDDLVQDPHRQQERTHIRLKAEIYAGKDSSYIPLLRFDTLLYTLRSVYSIRSPYSDWERNLTIVLSELADSASYIAAQKQGMGRQIPLTAIRQFNQSRFASPIDGDASLKRGVYASFEEFRNNTPSIQNYEIKLEGASQLLYLTEPGGRSYYSHDAWGYCDGKDIFIMRDGILRAAWKEGKALYFLASTTRSSTGNISPATGTMLGGAATGALIQAGHNSDYRSRSIFTIDMDTGSIY